MRLFYFSILLINFSLLNSQSCLLSAECVKCSKIEAERQEEKKRTPPPLSDYYEDRLSLNDLVKEKSSFNSMPKAGLLNESDDSLLLERQNLEANRLNLSDSASILSYLLDSKVFIEIIKGPFTLFIPSNEALKKLPPTVLEGILKVENQEKINTIFKNHIAGKKIEKTDFSLDKSHINSLSNRPLLLEEKNGHLMVNSAYVLRSEPIGKQGMIYIIDRVLIP